MLDVAGEDWIQDKEYMHVDMKYQLTLSAAIVGLLQLAERIVSCNRKVSVGYIFLTLY